MSKPYRDRLDKIYDVLYTISENRAGSSTTMSQIYRSANMSHYQTIEILDIIGAAGLVDAAEITTKGAPTFRITGSGVAFMREYETFMKMLEKKRNFSYRSLSKNMRG